MQNLQSRTLKGLFWSGIDNFGIYFIKFGFSIGIARLLVPTDYGLVGMMAIFIGVANMISESGLGMALIQKKDTTQEDFSTVFFFNLGVSVFFYFLFFVTAPSIASFFNEPRLIPVARVISLSIIIGSFSSIQTTKLGKSLEFKTQAKVNLPGALVSGVTGLILAYWGFGVWALIFQTLSGSLFRSVGYWVLSKWKPSLIFSISSFKNLYTFGWKIFLQTLSGTLVRNIYFPVIGKIFDTASLGFFTKARSFHNIFVMQVTIATQKVIFPVFSSVQENPDKFAAGNKKAFQLLVFILFPITTLLIVTAEPFVLFFLTEKWAPVIPYMQILYLEGYIFPLLIFNLNIANAIGRSDLSLKVNMVYRVLVILLLFIAIPLGLKWIIVGQVIATLVAFTLSFKDISYIINYEVKKTINDVSGIFLISVLVFIVSFSLLMIIKNSPLILMVLQIFIGVLMYYYINKAFMTKPYREFISIVQSSIPAKFKFLF